MNYHHALLNEESLRALLHDVGDNDSEICFTFRHCIESLLDERFLVIPIPLTLVDNESSPLVFPHHSLKNISAFPGMLELVFREAFLKLSEKLVFIEQAFHLRGCLSLELSFEFLNAGLLV